MIKTFRDDSTKAVFETGTTRSFPQSVLAAAARKLRYIDEADLVTDLLFLAGNRLNKLSGNRAGQWSIHQYRICFEWLDGDAYNVEIVDYH